VRNITVRIENIFLLKCLIERQKKIVQPISKIIEKILFVISALRIIIDEIKNKQLRIFRCIRAYNLDCSNNKIARQHPVRFISEEVKAIPYDRRKTAAIKTISRIAGKIDLNIIAS
jgi:hypothetical protein